MFAVSRFEYLPAISRAWTVRLIAIIVRMREKASKELILLDSGLVTKAGQSYRLAKTVSDALARRKLRYCIFGFQAPDQSIAAEFGAIPHFQRSLNDGVDLLRGEKRLRSAPAIFFAEDATSDHAAIGIRPTKKRRIFRPTFE